MKTFILAPSQDVQALPKTEIEIDNAKYFEEKGGTAIELRIQVKILSDQNHKLKEANKEQELKLQVFGRRFAKFEDYHQSYKLESDK